MSNTNTQGFGKTIPSGALFAAAFLGVFYAAATPSRAQSIAPAYAGSYKLNNIGVPPGLSSPAGGLAFSPANSNTLYVAGNPDTGSGAVYAITVVRDANGHITGFSGGLSPVAAAPNIDGGLLAGPGGDLFYTTYAEGNSVLGEIKPGGASASKLVALNPLGIPGSGGGLGLVPSGFPSAGHLKITSYDAAKMYDTTLSPDGSGTYAVSSAGASEYFGANNSYDSAVFIPAGNPDFGVNAALICDYSAGKVAAYQTNGNSDPNISSGNDFLVNLPVAAGIVIDPVTHDVLVEGQDMTGICVVSGFLDARISSLSPTSVPAGTSFTLTVNGSGFLPGAQILWNGAALSTTVTSTKLTASVPASVNGLLGSYPGSASISVQSADGTRSNAVSLSIAAPSLSVSNIKPGSVKADTAFTLTINGLNFRSGASVSWNGTPLTTTFVNSNQLTAAVTKSVNGFTASYPTAAVITITSPGSLTTGSETVTVTEPTPILTNLSPGGAPVGQGAFSITITGNGFVNGATINWNGVPMPSSVYSQTVISAGIPASCVASLGTFPITVTNPTSGGTSASRNFIVMPTRITLSVFGGLSRDKTTDIISIPILLINTGNQTAPSLTITSSSLGSDAAPTNTLPIPLGDVPAPYGVGFTVLTFKGTAGPPGVSATLTVSGTYTGGGTFHCPYTITLPAPNP